jgi:hypothetical protein
MKQQNMSDPSKIQRALLTVFLILATVALTYFGFTKNLPVVGLLIPVIGLASWLIGRPVRLLFLMMLAYGASLRIPGLPTVLNVMTICQVLLIGWASLDKALLHNSPRFSLEPRIDNWLAFFALDLLLIMFVRGAGFALLGGSTYGGTGYVMFFLAISSYFTVTRLRMTDSDIKCLLLIVLAGAIFAMITQVLSFYSGGGFGWLQKIFSVETESLLSEQESATSAAGGGGDAVVRWSAFGKVAYGLIPIAYVLCRKQAARFVLIASAFALVGMTGTRSQVAGVVMMVFFAGVYYSKNRAKTVLAWGLAGLFILGFLMIATPMLPRAVQRAVSFIEFIPVDQDIVASAETSSSWRFDMWRDYCIPNVPQYLLIGRGIAHDIAGFAWLNPKWYGTAEFFYYMGRYHSGPFSLLLDHGLPGTIGFTMFFLLTLADGWRTVRRYASKQDTLTSRYYTYLTLLMTYEVFNFYFIFGAPVSGMFRMLMVAALLRILKKNFLMEDSPEVNVQNVERLTGRPPPFKSANRWARTTADGGTPEHRSR